MLTDKACRAAKPGPKPIKLFDQHGLHLLVRPTGYKVWRWKYRVNRREKQLVFGPYPEVSLAEARALKDDARALLRTGIDPGANAASTAATDSRPTFAQAAAKWISLAVAPGAHAVVLMDQAGWHMTGKLDFPASISIIALPAKCPEPNPVENIWQFMRDNCLSNRVFTSHENIVDHCCEAWNKLVNQPWHIMTIGPRQWALGS